MSFGLFPLTRDGVKIFIFSPRQYSMCRCLIITRLIVLLAKCIICNGYRACCQYLVANFLYRLRFGLECETCFRRQHCLPTINEKKWRKLCGRLFCCVVCKDNMSKGNIPEVLVRVRVDCQSVAYC